MIRPPAYHFWKFLMKNMIPTNSGLMEKRYPDGTLENCKRVIRKKALKFVIVDGEINLTKKRKGKVHVTQ